jgi:hypothetical protein
VVAASSGANFLIETCAILLLETANRNIIRLDVKVYGSEKCAGAVGTKCKLVVSVYFI